MLGAWNEGRPTNKGTEKSKKNPFFRLWSKFQKYAAIFGTSSPAFWVGIAANFVRADKTEGNLDFLILSFRFGSGTFM
jgi:hypothetical protein